VLSHIEVSNFQSLRKLRIPLGKVTVVTGATGSGKSALFRAALLLARNAKGTSYITAGENSCTVATGGDLGATWGRGWAVGITRSNSPRGKNEYQVQQEVPTPQPGGYGWTGGTFTKLGGQVPPQAAELLGLDKLNFARQFDPPYLLSAPGTEIARRLGDLTNVSLVFGAAAEANRRRKQLDRDLDGARTRRDALLAEAQQFVGLGARRKAAAAAEEALGRVQAMAAQAERLEALADRLELLETRAGHNRAEAARQAPPSLARLDALAARIARLRELGTQLQGAERDQAEQAARADGAVQDGNAAEAAVHAALAAAGQCFTCGQKVA
jgi:DNA repair exonuclease SbcCD ATPase subunit